MESKFHVVRLLLGFGVLTVSIVGLAVQNQRLQQHLDMTISYQSQLQESSESNAEQRLQYANKVAAFDRARDTLEPDLNGQQLDHLDRFIDAQLSGIEDLPQ